MSRVLRLRPAVRALVMDPERRVLLVHFDFEDAEMPTGLWACPGGGVDPGEAPDVALCRELREELGLLVEPADVGDPIWFKETEFEMVDWDGQADSYYLVEVGSFEPAPQFSKAELLAEHVDDMRWWTVAELQEAQRADVVTVSPRLLVPLMNDLMANGRPSVPTRLDPL